MGCFPVKNWASAAAVAILLSGLSAIGCGSSSDGEPNGSVTVKVTYAGEPVTAGRVDLSSKATGDGGGAELDSAGKAYVKNVPHGEYVVTVVPPPPSPADLAPVPGQRPKAPPKYDNIPEKVRRSETSPLKVTVADGASEAAFELKQ